MKIKPNEYAKIQILDALDNLEETWEGLKEGEIPAYLVGYIDKDLTQKEIDKINEMMAKRITGIYKYFGFYKIKTGV